MLDLSIIKSPQEYQKEFMEKLNTFSGSILLTNKNSQDQEKDSQGTASFPVQR